MSTYEMIAKSTHETTFAPTLSARVSPGSSADPSISTFKRSFTSWMQLCELLAWLCLCI